MLLTLSFAVAAMPPVAAAGTTSWSWRAPPDADGPGAFRVTVDFGEENHCAMVAGGASDMYNGPGVFVSLGEGHEGMIWAHPTVQVHSSVADVDFSEIWGEAAGGMRMYWGNPLTGVRDPVSGVRDLTVLVSDMTGVFLEEPYEWDLYPAQIIIDCDEPFEVVGASGSREVVGFTDMTLEGTGASAGGGEVMPGVAVNVDDTLQRSFWSASVEVDVHDFDTMAEVRSWDLVTPTQTFAGMSSDLSVEDGPGDFLFSLTGVGDCPGCIRGWMAGYEPVGSLDDILG